MKMKQALSLGLVLSVMSLNTFAADNVAKEETTPPPAEGAMTIDQLQPMSSGGKAPSVATPATQTTTSRTVTVVAPR